MNMNGVGGTIFCGYQPAIRLGNWSVRDDPDAEGWTTISAAWAAQDEFWSTQTLTKITLELGNLRLSWDLSDWTGSQLIRVEGPPKQTVEEDDVPE